MENLPTQINIHVDPIPFDSGMSEIEAAKLTSSNVQWIKNLISRELNDLISLQLTPEVSADYFAKVAQIRGSIAAYSYLINAHHEAHAITSNQGN